MNVKNIGNPSFVSPNQVNGNNEVQRLEQQKKQIQQQIQQVKENKTGDNKTNKEKLESLEQTLKNIEAKIQKAKSKDAHQETIEKPSNSEKIYEKRKAEDQWDNTYSLIHDKDGVRIKFNRPKKED